MAKFGPWDLFSLIFHTGNVARHVAKENWRSVGVESEQFESITKRNSRIKINRDMEEKYRKMIDDPTQHDKIWRELNFYWYEILELEDREFVGPPYRYPPYMKWFIEGGKRPLDDTLLCFGSYEYTAKTWALICVMATNYRSPEFRAEIYYEESAYGRFVW